MKMKTVTYICSRCGGSGQSMKNRKPIKCPVCDGDGHISYKTLPWG